MNPNMPLRNLHYISVQLQKLIPGKKLYGSRRVEIPMPRFVVFYNGKQTMPERVEYRLSDLYMKKTDESELELKVTVLNINSGMNSGLLDGCILLKEYMIYTEKVRENMQKTSLEKAVEMAVDECIREGILVDFLTKQRAEVIAMSIFEYDQEGHMQLVREEGWEEGRAEGHAEGHAIGLQEGCSMGEMQKGMQIFHKLLQRGFSKEEAMEIVQISEVQSEQVFGKENQSSSIT